ncbi:MAG: hypothetical protein ACQESF_06060 [Nanobdellota archaeon]
MRYVLFLLILILMLPACTKTHEEDFTAEMLCKDKLKYQDPDDLRDEYDQCLLFTKDNLRDKDKCEKRCISYCEDNSWDFLSSYTDFSGCHCKCSEKIKVKK